MRDRFPGLSDGWARFDGPAGTQMVDAAIEAMRAHLSSGESANTHGLFAQSTATTAMVDRTRAAVATLLGGDAGGVVFGANMTTLTFALTRSIARTLGPGDEIVGTRLDHDANVTPWRLAARDAGATFTFAPFDPATGRLNVESVVERLGSQTRWLAITGASNALGTMPNLPPIVEAAHAVGAKVLVDAVHLAPHRPIDIGEIGCDALVTSAYKWYGPHAGILWLSPELRAVLEPYKVRPSSDTAPEAWETGTPSFEAIAGIGAAAEFLLEQGMERVARAESEVFAPLLTGLQALPRVRLYGPTGTDGRTPTAAFTVDGLHPDAVAAALASEQIAVWSGDYYAVEVMASLGLADSGGAVRVGVSRYTDLTDVERLLGALAGLD